MIALPSDVARAKPDVQASYQALLESMVGLFSEELKDHSDNVRQKALSLAALAVGGMILARTLPDSALA
jgi:TetR/AcrR family transcriptional repressor of nem operon